MDSVEIETPSEHLRLSAGPHDMGTSEHLTAELRVGSLVATTSVMQHYASGFADLAKFFAAMAKDWRGWSDVRVWESLEGELRITAKHDGHVGLQIQLRDGPLRLWSATGNLTLEAGEQLTRVAEGVHRLTSDHRLG